MEMFLVFIAFIAIVIAVYISYRKSEAKEMGTEYKGNGYVMSELGKKVLYYALIAITFVVVSICIISLEAVVFEEPKRGYVYGAFAIAATIAGCVGKLCKRFLNKRQGGQS